jgi:hypothetical protein
MIDYLTAIHSSPHFSHHPRSLQTLIHISLSLAFVIIKGWFGSLILSLDNPFPYG